MGLGELLRKERERQGLSLTEVGRLADIAPSVISRIENGETIGRVDSVAKIGTALGISPALIFASILESEPERILSEASARADRIRRLQTDHSEDSASERRLGRELVAAGAY